MNFISFEFLIFVSVSALVYFVLPARLRWPWLLVASAVFYLYSGVGPFLLLVAAIALNYGAGLWLARAGRGRGWILALSLAFNLGLLLVFKYFNFFNDSFDQLFEHLHWSYRVHSLDTVLPLGISFYTFQLMAYLIDIYRHRTPPERSLGLFATSIAFFPKIVAGPIERADHLLPQLRRPAGFADPRVVEGLRRVLWGVFRKVAIADRLGLYVNTVYSSPDSYSGWTLIVATLFFTFQIYCDFAAYSDIAIGLAQILGVDLVENFRQPYLSRSIREFWRRWHMSLSFWFRDYLYFPLGGSRVPLPRTLLNLMIVFVVSGLWHGTSWTFAVWGALHGLYIVVETLWEHRARRRVPPAFSPRPEGEGGSGLASVGRLKSEHNEGRWRAVRAFTDLLKTLLTFALVAFAWIFFRANSLDDAGYVVAHLLDFSKGFEDITGPFNHALFPQQIEFTLALVLVALLIAADWLDARRGLIASMGRGPAVLRWAVYYLLALAIGVSLWASASASQTFIYAKF